MDFNILIDRNVDVNRFGNAFYCQLFVYSIKTMKEPKLAVFIIFIHTIVVIGNPLCVDFCDSFDRQDMFI